MTTNNLTIKPGISAKIYGELIQKLYCKYPPIINSKIGEYELAFDPANPFFKYGKVRNYFIYEQKNPVGHLCAIDDPRAGEMGMIGFFEAQNNSDLAKNLFDEAAAFLRTSGKKIFRGPINLSVWQNFRVCWPQKEPPYFLEPFTLEYYRELFLNNGFIACHQNLTTTGSINESQIKNYAKSYDKSISQGYKFERLSPKNSEELTGDIYYLTSKCFKNSFSFFNISPEEFIYQAAKYTELPKPNYIFVLKKEKLPAGFFLAAADHFNPEEKRVVIKTMALAKEYRNSGLGQAMLYYLWENAKNDGFKKLVFSTMALENETIRSLTGKESDIYRHYSVFEKLL